MKTTIAFVIASCLAACAAPRLSAPSPAPDFALQDLSGATVRLADYRGRTVLLDFWATWCDPCRESIPRYVKMQDKLRAKGFVVIGADEDENPATTAAYARDHGMNYPVLRDAGTMLFKKYGGRSLPAAFLIDSEGNIRGRWDGFDAATGVDVELAVDKLLGAKPVKGI